MENSIEKPPKKNISAYLFFCCEKNNITLKEKSERWNRMKEDPNYREQIEKYMEMARLDKERYERENASFKLKLKQKKNEIKLQEKIDKLREEKELKLKQKLDKMRQKNTDENHSDSNDEYQEEITNTNESRVRNERDDSRENRLESRVRNERNEPRENRVESRVTLKNLYDDSTSGESEDIPKSKIDLQSVFKKSQKKINFQAENDSSDEDFLSKFKKH